MKPKFYLSLIFYLALLAVFLMYKKIDIKEIGNVSFTQIETSATELVMGENPEAEFKKLIGTKVSRADFAKVTKKMLHYYIDKNNYDDMFKYMDSHDLETSLITMMIIETSGKAKDGNWYPLLSDLSKHNNFFGIKARNISESSVVTKRTWEVINGKKVVIDAEFRSYETIETCLNDLMAKFKEKRYDRVRRSSSWAAFFTNLKLCGYMTDPFYPIKAVKITQDANIDLL